MQDWGWREEFVRLRKICLRKQHRKLKYGFINTFRLKMKKKYVYLPTHLILKGFKYFIAHGLVPLIGEAWLWRQCLLVSV